MKGYELPRSVGQLSKQECSKLLQKALKESGILTQTKLAILTGIPRGTLNNYFMAEYMPPQEKWNILREIFSSPNNPIPVSVSNSSISEVSEAEKEEIIKTYSMEMKALVFLLKNRLDFFQDSARAREILKKHIDSEEAGYVIALFKALYNEEELEIWKAFRGGKF